MKEFLRFNHHVLEDYILQDIPLYELERILIRKAQRNDMGQNTMYSLLTLL